MKPFANQDGKTIHLYEQVSNIILIAAIAGIVGARLFSILEYFDDFLQDPVGTIFSMSGLTYYGGLIFGALL